MIDVHEVNFPGGAVALQAEIDTHTAALAAHALTEGVAAPMASELVQAALNAGGFNFIPTPAPEPEPEPPTAEQIKAAALAATDAGMVRVVEDLLTLLEAKGVLTAAELPQYEQDKIAARAALRLT